MSHIVFKLTAGEMRFRDLIGNSWASFVLREKRKMDRLIVDPRPIPPLYQHRLTQIIDRLRTSSRHSV